MLQGGLKHADDLAIHVVLGRTQKKKSADDPAEIPGALNFCLCGRRRRAGRGLGIHRSYWFTPLAKNPPSAANTCPVTKLAASEAKNTAAPANSSSCPNRCIGVRSRNSFPRSVPSSNPAFNSVRKTPGAIPFTQTPFVAHSIASDFVSEATAALLAEYAATSCSATNEAIDAMLMMRPYFRSIMCRPKARQARSVPFKFVSIIPFQSESGNSSVGMRFVRPAQFTKISTLPNSASTAASNFSMLASYVTSQVCTSDRLPSAFTSAGAWRTSSARRPVGTTLAPASANPLFSASPIPLVPPITTAVFPLKSNFGCAINLTPVARALACAPRHHLPRSVCHVIDRYQHCHSEGGVCPKNLLFLRIERTLLRNPSSPTPTRSQINFQLSPAING